MNPITIVAGMDASDPPTLTCAYIGYSLDDAIKAAAAGITGKTIVRAWIFTNPRPDQVLRADTVPPV